MQNPKHESEQRFSQSDGHGDTVLTVPVVQVTASVVIALFLLQLLRRLLTDSQSSIGKGISGGLDFILNG